MIASSNIDGWIIAGGVSSRMGEDKAALEIGGASLMELAAKALSGISHGRISIAGDPREFAHQWPAIPDVDPAALGPISGLATALANGTGEWIGVISCDMPFVTGEVFTRLAAIAKPDADAVVPLQPDNRPQPLCALYRRQTVQPIVKDLIQGCDRSMLNLLSQISVQYSPFSAFRDLPYAEHLFFNINLPKDYERAKDICQKVRGPATGV